MDYPIFLSYRRADNRHAALNIKERIEQRTGQDTVFMDVTELNPGEHFPERLRQAAANCRVMLAIIGRNWLGENANGELSRIKLPGDYIRLELGIALELKTPIFPVLIDNARLPREADLPEELRDLPNWQCAILRDESIRDDLIRLVDTLINHSRIIEWMKGSRLRRRVRPEDEVPRWQAIDQNDADDFAEFLTDFPRVNLTRPPGGAFAKRSTSAFRQCRS